MAWSGPDRGVACRSFPGPRGMLQKLACSLSLFRVGRSRLWPRPLLWSCVVAPVTRINGLEPREDKEEPWKLC